MVVGDGGGSDHPFLLPCHKTLLGLDISIWQKLQPKSPSKVLRLSKYPSGVCLERPQAGVKLVKIEAHSELQAEPHFS